MLMTSRRETYLMDGFQSLSLDEIILTTSKADEDIARYVTEIVEEEPKLSRWSVELRIEIEHTLRDNAQGMYQMPDRKPEKMSEHMTSKKRWSLPKTLDDTYKRILLAVEEEDRICAARLLAWVIFIPKPLCSEILAEAIVFEPDMSEFDPDQRFVDLKDILGFCRNIFNSWYQRCNLNVCQCGYYHNDDLHLALSTTSSRNISYRNE
ncbi:hypothetical protein M422DRAFT_276864 [Sphaerobolus stellatus SS14]|uniref:Uncharacterized protein n=1 Tax=Sphaerobolus stellatus (strain SS14) TaxID=990650 RepID=A0A0C9UC51_SPHS4|nr:hypothetical protein M422DRAFT_276864 [Sphaerobolus stellatus SS14]